MPISSLFHAINSLSPLPTSILIFAFPRKLTLYWCFMSFTIYLTWACLDVSQGYPLLTHYPNSSGDACLGSSYRQNQLGWTNYSSTNLPGNEGSGAAAGQWWAMILRETRAPSRWGVTSRSPPSHLKAPKNSSPQSFHGWKGLLSLQFHLSFLTAPGSRAKPVETV